MPLLGTNGNRGKVEESRGRAGALNRGKAGEGRGKPGKTGESRGRPGTDQLLRGRVQEWNRGSGPGFGEVSPLLGHCLTCRSNSTPDPKVVKNRHFFYKTEVFDGFWKFAPLFKLPALLAQTRSRLLKADQSSECAFSCDKCASFGQGAGSRQQVRENTLITKT